MYKLVISDSNDVYYNLALESYLLSLREEIIFLWINKPTIVIGYNQNCYKETNIEYLKHNNIDLARRITGGGCVYHDLNNLNVSLITKSEDSFKLNNILKDVLRLFNIESVVSKSNDLLIDDKKFSGQACYQENDISLYHSSILVDVDLNVLSKAITPSKLKLETHAIDSVRKRVVNLKSINNDISVSKLIDAFKRLDYVKLTNIEVDEDKVNKIREKYASHSYIYGNNPLFTYKEEKLINNDIFDICLSVDENIIKEIEICSDSMKVFNFESIYEKFKGKEFLEEKTIQNIIDEIKKLY